MSRGFSHGNGVSDVRALLSDSWGSAKARKKKRIAQNSKVYFIREGAVGPFKIGISSKVKKRMTTLQTANSEELFLMGVIVGGEEIEDALHQRFEKFLKRGEWYHPHPELIREIREILERGSI